jgi:hypothetical protein
MRSFICAILVLVAGCKDDNLYGINADTKTYLLVNKKWQTSAIFVKSKEGIVIRDEYTLQPAHLKDDYFFFRADSTFELNDNAVRDPLAPSPVLANGTWNLLMGEQFLKLKTESLLTFQDSVKISSISENSLTLERPVLDGIASYSYKVVP